MAPQPTVWGVHDFVGLALFQNAVLVDAAGVGEGVFADDGFAALDGEAAHAGDEAGAFDDFAGVDGAVEAAEEIAAGLEGHDDFLEGGVAGALANAVDGAFDLTGAVGDGGEGIGDGEAEGRYGNGR